MWAPNTTHTLIVWGIKLRWTLLMVLCSVSGSPSGMNLRVLLYLGIVTHSTQTEAWAHQSDSSAVQAKRWGSQGCADASAWVWPPAFPPTSQDLRGAARTPAFLPIFQQQTEKSRQWWDEPGISLLSSWVLCWPPECQRRPRVVLEGSSRLHTWEE